MTISRAVPGQYHSGSVCAKVGRLLPETIVPQFSLDGSCQRRNQISVHWPERLVPGPQGQISLFWLVELPRISVTSVRICQQQWSHEPSLSVRLAK